MSGTNHFRHCLRGWVATTTGLMLCIGISTTASAAELPPEETYAVHGLYSLGNSVSDMNDKGVVSGHADVNAFSDTLPHAGIWDEYGNFNDLQPKTIYDASFASGINNNGDVVGTFAGYSGEIKGPVLFSGGEITPLLDLNGIVDGSGFAYAQDINDHGLIVGCTNSTPVVWDNSKNASRIAGTPEGATGCALTANNQGDIIGYAAINGITHARLWRDGQMIDLGTLPGHEHSIAFGINELGQVVGFSQDRDGSHGYEQHPFLWDKGVMTDLGTLSGNKGIAYDINDQGHIVGNAPGPFLYRKGVMYDLKSIAPTLQTAQAINETGQIAGNSAVLTPASDQLDLAVTLTAPKGPIDSGTEFNYEITVTNRSTVNGEGVKLEYSLSSQLQVISMISSQGTCSTIAPVVCELGTVATDGTVKISMTVKAEVPPSNSGNLVYVSNYVRMYSTNKDVNSTNNSAYQATSITPPPISPGADVAVNLSDSPDPVRRGGTLTYTATVVNNGPITATKVQFDQSIYARFRMKSISTTKGSCSGKSPVKCALGDMAPDEKATITIFITPRERSGTRFFSTANISSNSPDPVLNNNSVLVMTNVQ